MPVRQRPCITVHASHILPTGTVRYHTLYTRLMLVDIQTRWRLPHTTRPPACCGTASCLNRAARASRCVGPWCSSTRSCLRPDICQDSACLPRNTVLSRPTDSDIVTAQAWSGPGPGPDLGATVTARAPGQRAELAAAAGLELAAGIARGPGPDGIFFRQRCSLFLHRMRFFTTINFLPSFSQ